MKLTADQVEPAGYHLLVELKTFEEKTEAGIVLTSSIVNREQADMVIGKVLKIGPLCYQSHAQYLGEGVDPTPDNLAAMWGFGPGSWVQFPRHAYMRVAGEKTNLVFVLDYDIKARVNIE